MNVLLSVLFLVSSAMLAGMTTALLDLGKLHAKEAFKKNRSLFFFQHFLKPLFGKRKWEGLFFTMSFTKHVLHLCYCVVTIFILLTQEPFSRHTETFDSLWVLAMGAIIITISLVADMVMKFLATAAPTSAFRLFAPLSSVFLTLFSPLTAFFMRSLQTLFPRSSAATRDKILEVLYESDLPLDPQERKLILSVANFKGTHVREIMVPRINVLALSEEASLSEAKEVLSKERYSRLPVYQDNIDHIIGVLMYKDIAFAQEGPLRSYIKPVLYTPETKKISQLLQEFRNKQIHMAIVVDEYGGTEGIITTEDILEELVGEIADEDDIGQEVLYTILPTGGWIVDAQMTILDIEKELGIQIPSSPEYDTLGGYIYHRAGAIPSIGWRLHHDDFDLEILSSDDRSLEKIRIVPHASEEEQ